MYQIKCSEDIALKIEEQKNTLEVVAFFKLKNLQDVRFKYYDLEARSIKTDKGKYFYTKNQIFLVRDKATGEILFKIKNGT